MADSSDDLSPRSDDEAVMDPGAEAVATTAARALAMGAALSAPDALIGLSDDFPTVGIRDVPSPWASSTEREDAIDESDSVLSGVGILAEVRAREEGGWRAPRERADPDEHRV
jgi:hypothetical protein